MILTRYFGGKLRCGRDVIQQSRKIWREHSARGAVLVMVEKTTVQPLGIRCQARPAMIYIGVMLVVSYSGSVCNTLHRLQ